MPRQVSAENENVVRDRAAVLDIGDLRKGRILYKTSSDSRLQINAI